MDAIKEHLIHENPIWLVCSAATQSAGRGTTGRTWVSTTGNVFVTIAMRESLLPMMSHRMKLWALVGLAQCAALREICPWVPARLKWPNDVLVEGQKLSGSLIEHHGDHFLIGIGLNVAHCPEVPSEGGRQPTSLAMHCTQEDRPCPDAQTVIHSVVTHLHRSVCGPQPMPEAEILRQYSSEVDWSQQYVTRKEDGSRGRFIQPRSLDEFGGLVFTDVETGQEGVQHASYFD